MAEKSNMRYVKIVNITNLFTRELRMYSLGDIRLGQGGVSLKKVAYTTAFFLLWSMPIVLIFGIHLNVYFAALVLVPPVFLGHFASKPVWGGKNLVDYMTTLFTYIGEPSSWTDLRENREKKNKYYVESEIWISRRRELQMLADLKEKRIAENAKKNPASRKKKRR